jgi:membrane protein implicated in regulation of membrane protease activity
MWVSIGAIAIGGLLVLVTIVTGAVALFEFFLIGSILVLSGVFGMLFESEVLVLVLSIILSIIYLVFGRRYFFKKLDVKTVKTNSERLIGQKGTVIKNFSDGVGLVKVDGEEWRAVSVDSEDYLKGSTITVEELNSTTLKVRNPKS